MSIQVKVIDHVLRPVEKVFNSIVDPTQITKYFVSDANDKLVEGNKVSWEFKDYNVKLNVEVLKVIENEQIIFDWEASGNKARVSMSFSSEEENKTKLVITEDFFETNEEGIAKALQQTQGWTDFICSLKAYLYTGINLRNGKMN
ncbi:SRPBCC domain-containing protein [Gillisia marina]|uniref:SRPBCC domain-containing protein n=1 Tax=Gillisia marina TaxID=1167637 RepID=UPI00029B30A8|nr:SRPBCC domain-containing protein [Gillisia marina]